MTKKIEAKVYEFPGFFSIAAPATWEPILGKRTLDFVNEHPSDDRRSTMNIKLFENPDAVADDMPSAIQLAIDFAEGVDWQIEEDDVGEYFVDGNAVASFTKMARNFTSGKKLPRPVLWQVWIVMGDRLFASIKHRIDDPIDGEELWDVGHSVVRTFQWDEG